MAEASFGETRAELEVMAHFDKDASGFDFDRTASGYRLRHRLVRSLFFKKYRPGAFALDLGCGTGEYALSLAEAGYDVVGGDVLLAQVISHLLYEPKEKVLEDKILKATQPIDRHPTNLPLFKSLSEHYIIEARKK